MNNFSYYNPTRIHFGDDALSHIVPELEANKTKKLLFVYGRESIKKNGVYKRIIDALSQTGIRVVEHAGVKGNPVLSHTREGVSLAKREQVDAVLAVGGGSVIDEAKIIAAGALCEEDVWGFFDGSVLPGTKLPLFSVLTLPATGSEMNQISVITNEDTQQKSAINIPGVLNPDVSFLDPRTTFSLSPVQTAYASVDIISHLSESYLTTSAAAMSVPDGLIESLIKTVMETTYILLEDPHNYQARANFMWAATMGWNGIVQLGLPDRLMPCHGLEMPMSGVYDIIHGAGLAIITPAWLVFAEKLHKERILKFGKTIFGVEATSTREVADALKSYYIRIGAPVSFSDCGVNEPDIALLSKLAMDAFAGRGISGYSLEDIKTIFTDSL